ncbi:cobalt ECF transporter T component CbiQ [Metabacillus litoralis]|uniref:cobalt ECF transporter T component CbiQ n=1 Tax=Metabacillus litoralis TaxID=152268 RepID=UPI001CFEC1BD|nr:cobalt ECF transporter T component CbiQ [Metabacillus litoralis]
MNNSLLRIDQYAYTNSLKYVHPAEKSIIAFSFLFFSILTKSLYISGFVFMTMTVLIIFAAKIQFWQYIKFLLIPTIFLLTSMITIILSFASASEIPNNTIWSTDFFSWVVYISPSSFNQAYHLAATVLASVSCLYFLIVTTPLQQLLWVLRKIKLPVLFIELIGLTYQFIFVLLASVQEIYLAQSSRLGYQNYRLSLSSISMLVANIFIKSLQTAKETQMAIDSRGGDEHLYDIEINLTYRKSHITVILCSITLLLILSILT